MGNSILSDFTFLVVDFCGFRTQMIIINSYRIYHIWYSKEWFEPWDQTRPDRCWKSCLCNNYDKHHIWNLVSVSVPGPMQCTLKCFQFTTFVLISTFLFRLLIMRHVKNLAEDICKNSFIFIEENKCDKCANRFRIKWREKQRIYFEETRRWFIQYICVHLKKISYMYECGFHKRR